MIKLWEADCKRKEGITLQPRESVTVQIPVKTDDTVTENGLTFGQYFKAKRIDTGKTLREFCREYDLDPGNVSRLERDRIQAPRSEKILFRYANYLRLHSEEWSIFRDLAAISAKRIPADLTDKEVARRLPLLFGIARDKQITKEKLEQLVAMIRES
jgi:transcriptional regulator with XRE-family HTH domain